MVAVRSKSDGEREREMAAGGSWAGRAEWAAAEMEREMGRVRFGPKEI